jgi:hypothetical protein
LAELSITKIASRFVLKGKNYQICNPWSAQARGVKREEAGRVRGGEQQSPNVKREAEAGGDLYTVVKVEQSNDKGEELFGKVGNGLTGCGIYTCTFVSGVVAGLKHGKKYSTMRNNFEPERPEIIHQDVLEPRSRSTGGHEHGPFAEERNSSFTYTKRFIFIWSSSNQ